MGNTVTTIDLRAKMKTSVHADGGDNAPDTMGANLIPVGVADGRIRDHQMTASSVGYGCEPHYARLHKASGEQWCWCCDESAKHDLQQWLQVDLGHVASIGGVQTQGGDKDGWEEAPSHFELHLSNDGKQWQPAKGEHGGIDFWHCKTAENVRRVTTHVLDGPISARYVRFVVKGWVGPNPSLRVEILVSGKGPDTLEESLSTLSAALSGGSSTRLAKLSATAIELVHKADSQAIEAAVKKLLSKEGPLTARFFIDDCARAPDRPRIALALPRPSS